MANKTQIKEFLKKTGYTESDMQEFWDNVKDIAPVIKLLARSGHTWKDLAPHQLEQLPTLKEKVEENLRKDEEEKKAQAEKEKREADEKAYYEEHFEELMVKKIDNHEALTEAELKRVVWDYQITQETGSRGRWTTNIRSIVEMMDRYFAINWQEANTEYQENEFPSQPREVKKHVYEKTIVVTEYNEI